MHDLAILVELRLVVDRHRHRAIAYYRASIASRGKKLILASSFWELVNSWTIYSFTDKSAVVRSAPTFARRQKRANNHTRQ